MSDSSPKIVVIGGGTGSFTLLSALKEEACQLTALVNMSDDGGSTGVLRDELGVLPPGDVRQCLVALSRSPKIRELFTYRFTEGTFKGHSFGNLFLTALEKVTGNFGDAVETASEVLNITGRVVPITLDNVRLALEGSDGSKVVGEHKIDVLKFSDEQRRPKLTLEPAAVIHPDARQAIMEADLVVVAPGDLYTSLGALLVVQGVGQALQDTPAKVAYVCNLVVKPGHTDGLSVADHAAEIERFVNAPILDCVLYNTAAPDPQLMQRYAQEGEVPVEVRPAEFSGQHYEAIAGAYLGHSAVAIAPADESFDVPRSYIRHDGEAISRSLMELVGRG